MIIAVTYQDGEVFQHFGHSQQFKIYDTADGAVKSGNIVDTNGSGHGALSDFLKAHKVDALICGGIGGGARTALGNAGIQLYPGVKGNADAQVQALLDNNLTYNPDTVCNHHHEEGHECGENHAGCGGNSCGH